MKVFVTSVIALLTLATVAAQDVKTRYYLPKTVITITGVTTTKGVFVETGGQVSVQPKSETGQININLAAMPDDSKPFDLVTASSLFSKTTSTIQVSQSGLLVGVNTKSEGQLGTFVRNIFSAAVSLATVASGGGLAGLLNATESPAEKLYATEAPDAATRRTKLKSAVNKALEELLTEQTKLLNATTPDARKSSRERIEFLKMSLGELRIELTSADAAFDAWKSRKENASEKPVTLMFDVDRLPQDAGVHALAIAPNPPSEQQLKDAVGVFEPTLATTGIIVTQDRAPIAAPTVPGPGQGVTSTEHVTYRHTRPAIITIYGLNSARKPVLIKRSVEMVVDRAADPVSMPVFNSKWTTKSLAVTFTGAAATTVTTEVGSSAGAVSDMVKGLPADLLAALKQGNDISAEHAKIQQNALQNQIDLLKKQKALNEEKVASGESLDMATLKQQTDRITAEIGLLEKQRALASAQTTGADISAMQTQKTILELQNSLIDAQKKQLELQQQLDDLRKRITAGGGL